MQPTRAISYENKASFYRELVQDLEGYLEDSSLANLANASALLMMHLPRLNWVGFYLFDGEELSLGPFQGRPACVKIPLSKGVCGAAARERVSVVVPDVDRFPGHIVCDSASKSEIVVPMIVDGKLYGVLDVDSPELARFDDDDRRGLEALVAKLTAHPSLNRA